MFCTHYIVLHLSYLHSRPYDHTWLMHQYICCPRHIEIGPADTPPSHSGNLSRLPRFCSLNIWINRSFKLENRRCIYIWVWYISDILLIGCCTTTNNVHCFWYLHVTQIINSNDNTQKRFLALFSTKMISSKWIAAGWTVMQVLEDDATITSCRPHPLVCHISVENMALLTHHISSPLVCMFLDRMASLDQCSPCHIESHLPGTCGTLQ